MSSRLFVWVYNAGMDIEKIFAVAKKELAEDIIITSEVIDDECVRLGLLSLNEMQLQIDEILDA